MAQAFMTRIYMTHAFVFFSLFLSGNHFLLTISSMCMSFGMLVADFYLFIIIIFCLCRWRVSSRSFRFRHQLRPNWQQSAGAGEGVGPSHLAKDHQDQNLRHES